MKLGQDGILYSANGLANGGKAQQGCTSVGDFKPDSAFNGQIGGNWYSRLPIQPGEFAMANGLNYWQSHALTYLVRYKEKNGKQDLEKCIDCVRKLLESEYGRQPEDCA